MEKYKAIIYDIDGTVLNTLNMNMYPLIKIIQEETGVTWSFEEVSRFASYPGMKVMEELEFSDTKKTYARWVQYVNEYEEGATLYDGFLEVFEVFHEKGYVQAYVSAKTKKQYEIDIISKDLDQYIETVVLFEDTDKHKPDPEPLLKCLENLNLKPENAIYIGDTLADYQAAKNAGMDFGYASWGSVSSDGIIEPKYIFDEPIDLLKLI